MAEHIPERRIPVRYLFSVLCAPRIIRSAAVSAAATSAGPGAWDFPDSRRWRALLRPRTGPRTPEDGRTPFGSGCASVPADPEIGAPAAPVQHSGGGIRLRPKREVRSRNVETGAPTASSTRT